MTVLRLCRTVISSVQCCILYCSCARWYAHTHYFDCCFKCGFSFCM